MNDTPEQADAKLPLPAIIFPQPVRKNSFALRETAEYKKKRNEIRSKKWKAAKIRRRRNRS